MDTEHYNNGWGITPEEIAGINNYGSDHQRYTQVPPEIAQALKQQVENVEEGEEEWVEDDGYLRRTNEIYVPNRMFVCEYTPADEKYRKKAKVNRTYNRYTQNTVPSILGQYGKPLGIYHQGQNTSEYIQTYENTVGSLNLEDAMKPESQWGSALILKDGGVDFAIVHADVVRGVKNWPVVHTKLEREGELLSTEFAIRNLSVGAKYTNYGKVAGRLAHISISPTHTPEGWHAYDNANSDSQVPKELVIRMYDDGKITIPTFIKGQFGNFDEDYDHPFVLEQEQTIYRNERFMTVKNTADAIKITVGKKEPSSNTEMAQDFTVTIPKLQEVKRIIDHNGNEVNRYEVENNLIADALRRQPFQLPHKADTLWRFADIRDVMKIKVEKNIHQKKF